MPSKRRLRCAVCGRDFDTPDPLRTHRRRHHPRAADEVRWWMVSEEPDVLPFEGR
ncbi:hypothetical protein [Halegenticoccus soli]|uniref:hypothetical protein n=1 Tax=Halegenticoccus soli TaxID=1985678 RepID=UPI0018EBA423|nr:hypothetical protein [Halegenticoccus soli]